MSNSHLLTIVGPTGSGKTALALQLAQQSHGQIICADSRSVYKGMDIGTAKPSLTEQAQIKHYGLDLVTPAEPFTVSDFKRYAYAAIAEVASNSHLPILVGGSGLFIDAVLFDFQFRSPANPELRAKLELLSTIELQQEITENGWLMPENVQNRRYLIRTIETAGIIPKHGSLRPNTLVLGLRPEREELQERLLQRAGQMVANGLVEEATAIGTKYGWDVQAMRAPGYNEVAMYHKGNLRLQDMAQAIARTHYALAKRQLTWFKRNKSIHWLDNGDVLAQAVALTTTFLDTKS